MGNIISLVITVIGFLIGNLSVKFLEKVLNEKAFVRLCLLGFILAILSITVSI